MPSNTAEYMRLWKRGHPEKVRAYRIKERISQRRYRQTHRNEKRVYNRRYRDAVIEFRGKQIRVIPLGQKVRSGVCSFCGKKGRTNMHHLFYDPIKPLKYTVEACVSCHNQLHFGKERAV